MATNGCQEALEYSEGVVYFFLTENPEALLCMQTADGSADSHAIVVQESSFI